MNPKGGEVHAQLDFRFLINIQPGQCIGVVRFGEHFVNILESEEAEVATAADYPGLAKNELFDYLLISNPTQQELGLILEDFQKSIGPSTGMLLCIKNKYSLRRFTDSSLPKHSLRDLRRILNSNRFIIDSIYGIYENFEEPRYFIPLANRWISSYFFQNILTPYTFRSKILLKLFPFFVYLGIHSALFEDICLIARSERDSDDP